MNLPKFCRGKQRPTAKNVGCPEQRETQHLSRYLSQLLS